MQNKLGTAPNNQFQLCFVALQMEHFSLHMLYIGAKQLLTPGVMEDQRALGTMQQNVAGSILQCLWTVSTLFSFQVLVCPNLNINFTFLNFFMQLNQRLFSVFFFEQFSFQ